jgi:dolichol-phosphate mannosyltransferase
MYTSRRSANRTTRVIVVLPAYNEAAGIASLINGISGALGEARLRHELIVVNDGSTDGTLSALQGLTKTVKQLRIVNHGANQGLGSSIRDGLSCASALADKNDVIVTMDADETHAPALILRLVGLIREGFDVVIASRYQPGSRVVGVTAGRRFLSFAASALFRLAFPAAGVRDYTCGYRAYRAEVLQRALSDYGDAFVDQAGFQCMVDILLKLRSMKCVFGEVPIVLRYDRKQGASKMPVTATILSTLKLLVVRRLGA